MGMFSKGASSPELPGGSRSAAAPEGPSAAAPQGPSAAAPQEPPAAPDGRVGWPKLAVSTLLSAVGVALLTLVAIGVGYRSNDLHQSAIADPANVEKYLQSGSMAIIFNQPVTGQLNVALDLRPGSTVNHIIIRGFLHRKLNSEKSIRWAVFSYGALKLFPLANVGGYPTDAKGYTINTNGHPLGNGAISDGGTVTPVNVDPALCDRNIAKPLSNAGLSKAFTCMMDHMNDPSFVPGKLELHSGTITLGKSPYMEFDLDGHVVGTLEASSAGRIEAITNPIGGDSVLNWMQDSWNAKNVPSYSQEAIWKSMINFMSGGPSVPYPSSDLTVHETIQTAWSDSTGALAPDTNIVTGATAFSDPTRLALTWSPSRTTYNSVIWEIENRLEQNVAQSQDFLAGIMAAVAATAALMALAVIGNLFKTLIIGRMKD